MMLCSERCTHPECVEERYLERTPCALCQFPIGEHVDDVSVWADGLGLVHVQCLHQLGQGVAS